MGLKEAQEELKKQLAEAEEAEKGDSLTEEKQEEVVETKEEKTDSQEEKKEEVKADKKTNADYARERRERLKEQERLREDLAAANARIAELTKPKEEVKRDEEPNKSEDPEAWAEWRTRQSDQQVKEARELAEKAYKEIEAEKQRKANEILIEKAQDELKTYEEDVKKTNPDYDDVKQFYANALAFSIKTMNPRITTDALVKAVNNQILLRASQYFNEGYENPVQAMYEEAKSMGYQPKKMAEEEKKPDLERVAKNRERNAGTAAAAGSGGRGEITKRYAATEMTVQDWARLPKSERERILRQ